MSILQGLITHILDLFADLFLYASFRVSAAYLLGFAALGLTGLLTLYFSRRLRRGQLPILRGIDGIYDLQPSVEAAAETGKSVHFSIGTGSLGDALTLQTLAGLDVLKEVSAKAALAGPPFIATTSSSLALPALESTVRSAYDETTSGAGFRQDNDRFIAPTPVAYAAGTMRVLERENVGLNVMVGAFGDEYLLIGGAGARRSTKQVVATADPLVLPFVVATADYPIIGEELFALSSYLRPLPVRIGSIMAQDVVRLVVVALILASVVAVSFSPNLRELVASLAPDLSYP